MKNPTSIKDRKRRRKIHTTGDVCCINCLFEKTTNGNYTRNALLYQNILEYFDIHIQKENQQSVEFRMSNLSFTTQTITKWLLKKNLEFIKYYSGLKRYMTTSAKISNRLSTVERFVNDLVGLNLLIQSGMQKSSKNQISTPVYSITEPGIIVFALIKYNSTDNDKLKHHLRALIFDTILRYFRQYNSHICDFLAQVYSKAIKAGYSKSMIDLLLVEVHRNKHTIRTLVEAFSRVFHTHLTDERTRNYFMNTWIETVNEFPEHIQKIIIYHEKADIESYIHLVQPPKEWEEKWINNIQNYSQLTLYGKCHRCSNGYPVIVDYYEYRRESLSDGTVKRNCLKCNGQNTLAISNEIR